MSRPSFSRRGLHQENPPAHSEGAAGRPSPDRRHRSVPRRGRMCPLTRLLWSGLALVALSFFLVGAWQLSIMNGAGESNNVASSVGSGGRVERPDGSFLRFVPSDLAQRFGDRRIAQDRWRSELGLGLRSPRLALVIEGTNNNSYLLMLLTLVKSLMDLGYTFMVFVLENSRSRFMWENVGCQVSVLKNERSASIDWSIYEGVILSSIEGRKFIPRLMQEPFMSVPLIWLVHEDILGKRLSHYVEWGWHDLISEWSLAFTRADVIVFPHFSLPILHSLLDSGNFYVISGYPVDMWAINDYIASHSRLQLRKDFKFSESDLLTLVLGDYSIYEELPWDTVMETLIPQVKMEKYFNVTLKLVFLCCNSTDASSSTLQEVASRMGFSDGSVRQYGMDQDLKSFLLMVDIVLYWSYNAQQSFPPPLLLAMSFEIPVVAPNLPVIEKYVVDSVHGILFDPRQPDTLDRALSLLIEDKKLSNVAKSVASNGKLLSINMLASECIVSYAQLLEYVLHLPSDTLIPYSSSQNQQKTWLWDLLDREIKQTTTSMQVSSSSKDKDYIPRSSIVHMLEEEYSRKNLGKDFQIENMSYDFPNESDWNIVNEMQVLEDNECRETQELDERIERTSGSWEDVYRNARKSDKQKAEAYERDEGELRRTGQSLIIYEMYPGEGAWPFLHNGSMYRGLALSYSGRRSNSEDVEADSQLPFLNDTYYKDLLCETGGMFAVANRVDEIHKLPWIGFQSWRAYGRRVSLSLLAERVLETAIREQPKGDIMYYWSVMNIEVDKAKTNKKLDFWSICDHLNAAQCRVMFADAIRQMYGLPPDIPALPPMPFDGDHWSILHSWAMPTSSFLEFIMFSRMFADSLDCLTQNSNSQSFCVLGSSEIERRHCYCRVLEVLVNVWAYHSARRMVYLDPSSGILKEQHPLERRHMWVKYFNFDLLKSMDEDLAEKADDGMHPRDRWLWPLTGEVHWQGIVDREREERLKQKMDKKKKAKVKLLGRHKHGYKQKSLGL